MSPQAEDETRNHPYAEQSQQALEELLFIDLGLAQTFLSTAAIDLTYDHRRLDPAIEKAREALSTVKRFLPRVEDPVSRALIAARAAEIEASMQQIVRASAPYPPATGP